jgi:hypothetical protein
MNKRFWLGLAAYVVPTFALGYTWHLVLFAHQYQVLQIYRPDLIFPFGLLAMLIQGSFLSWLFPQIMRNSAGASWALAGLKFGLLVGLFAWSYSTIAVAAKHVMTSVPLFLGLETGFTVLHYAIVGPLIAFAHRR